MCFCCSTSCSSASLRIVCAEQEKKKNYSTPVLKFCCTFALAISCYFRPPSEPPCFRKRPWCGLDFEPKPVAQTCPVRFCYVMCHVRTRNATTLENGIWMDLIWLDMNSFHRLLPLPWMDSFILCCQMPMIAATLDTRGNHTYGHLMTDPTMTQLRIEGGWSGCRFYSTDSSFFLPTHGSLVFLACAPEVRASSRNSLR